MMIGYEKPQEDNLPNRMSTWTYSKEQKVQEYETFMNEKKKTVLGGKEK